MHRWTPPKGSKVVFSIDSVRGEWHPSIVPPGGRTVDEVDRLCREFCKRFELKYGKFVLPVTDKRWLPMLDALEESRAKEELKLGICWIEEPMPKASDPDAWFKLSGGAATFKSPARMSGATHFSWHRDTGYLASDGFRSAVLEAGLTGLDYVPLESSSSSDPMLWYQVFATRPIGRGLDHPLFDPMKLPGGKGKKNLDWYVNGEPVPWAQHFRDEVEIADPVVERLLQVAPRKYFRVVGPERYVREHLPGMNFAYTPWGGGDKLAGTKGRNCTICCSQMARKALVDAGVMKPARFEAVATVPAAQADSLILDRVISAPFPLPAFTPEEAAAERARREPIIRARMTSGVGSPRAPVFDSVDELAKTLERRLADGTASWRPAREEAELLREIESSDLFGQMPGAWRRVLPLLPVEVEFYHEEEDEGFDFQLAIPEWNDWTSEAPYADPEEAPSERDLVLGRTPYGDWYAVRAGDPLLPADGCVRHWDHETCTPPEEWPGVAAFAAHLVWMCDRAAEAAG